MITFNVFIRRQITEYYCGSYRKAKNEPARPSGGPRISGNGVHMYEGAGFALLILSSFS